MHEQDSAFRAAPHGGYMGQFLDSSDEFEPATPPKTVRAAPSHGGTVSEAIHLCVNDIGHQNPNQGKCYTCSD
ncbi:hypothetical protein D5S17_11740 [Pseudonocardiaceae bacterium YIM PH 21723]|nr:hypothetical protein D5S17_11740 [Pseudonocardiaceae bacterium YIM PH 21723]